MSITVTLANESQWEQFQPHNEMIGINRPKPLFPSLDFDIQGLEANSMYRTSVHLERVDDRRYSHKNGVWTARKMTRTDNRVQIPAKTKEVHHMFGGAPGEKWMKQKISFCFLKITNDPKAEDQNTICIQSMHKYVAVLTITKYGDNDGEEFKLPLTEFITVTGYKNDKISQLKTELNKYARNDYKRDHDNSTNGPAAKKQAVQAVPLMNPVVNPLPNPLLNQFQLAQAAQLAQTVNFPQLVAMFLAFQPPQNLFWGQPVPVQVPEVVEAPEDEIIDVVGLDEPEDEKINVENQEENKENRIPEVLEEMLDMVN